MAANLPMIDRVRLRSKQWRKLRSIILNLTTTDSFYGRKFRKWKLRTTSMNRLQDFIQTVPPTTKEEILADRLKHPPFGTNLTRPLAHYTRFCQTSGTSTGQSMAWLDTPESWSAMLDCWKKVYTAADLVPGEDRIFFAFSFGPFLGFWTAFEAAGSDYLAIPGGGQSSQARLETMARCGATVLCCTPTYALRLGEARAEHPTLKKNDIQIRKLIVAGEPGGSIPAVRERLEKLWGARVYDHHGMTEVGPVSYETTALPRCLVVIEESYLAEIVDPQTGAEVEEGQYGELLLTTLDRTACPLLRYRTGDYVLKRIENGHLCLQGGVLSRIDDMVVIRGVNIYPSAIESVLRQSPHVEEFRVRHHQVDAMDELTIEVEPRSSAPKNLAKELEARLRDTFSLRIPVRLTAPGSLPRHEFKAKRWVRD